MGPVEELERYGYPALAVLVLLEGIGIPTPAVSAVLAASVLAGHGAMSLPAVAAVTFLAAVAGDNLGYGLGRRAGRPAILRWGRRVGITEPRLARAERFFARRGRDVVLVARFVDGLRQTNGLIAGAVAMPWPQYAIRDAIGGAVWTAWWVTVGAVTGGNLDRVWSFVERYRVPVLVALLVVVGIVVLARFLGRRRA